MGGGPGECSFTGCRGKIPFEGKYYCLKHACTRCVGKKYMEPVFGVRVPCPKCNGKGTLKHGGYG